MGWILTTDNLTRIGGEQGSTLVNNRQRSELGSESGHVSLIEVYVWQGRAFRTKGETRNGSIIWSHMTGTR